MRTEGIDFYRSNHCYAIDCEVEDGFRPAPSLRSVGSRDINIINTRYGRLWIEGGEMTFYHYLDVLVQDQNGDPVAEAEVSVVNEVDPTKGAINLHTSAIFTPGATGHLLCPQPIRVTKTDSTGHTPLPREKEKTLVIAEKHVSRASPWHKHKLITTRYSYTITARKGALFGKVTGVRPDDTWYRPDPNEPTHTVVLRLFRKVTSGRTSLRPEKRGEPPAAQRDERR